MGVFRTKFVTENVRNCRETGEREGEAQNPTLHAKFSKKPSIDSRERQGSVSNFMNGPKMWNGGISFKKKMPACGGENKIGNFTQLSLDTKKYRTRGT